MDAANPLCRWLLLSAALSAVIGCTSTDKGSGYPVGTSNEDARRRWDQRTTANTPDTPPTVARPQMPDDPLGPIAPPPTPPGGAPPFSPIAPFAPTAPSPGVVPAIPGGAVVGAPVPRDAKGPVVPTSFVGAKPVTAAELLKTGVPRVKVVAIVGANNVITDQEVIESVWQQNEELARLDGREREIKQKELYTAALRKTIERELILDEMYTKLKKAGKAAVIEEIKEFAANTTEKQLREMKKKIGCKTDEELNAWLRVQGLTLPVLRRQYERQIMAQQYVNSMLKEKGRRCGLAEIRDYYDKHASEFQTPDRVKWQHIFVSFGNPPNAQAAAGRMEAIRQQVGAKDFAALAVQFDEGVARNQRGFGAGEKPGEIVPADLEQTVLSLKAGQVSGVLQTPTGYHLVKVVERDYAGVRPFDAKIQGEIRDKINDAFYETDRAKLVEELWRKGVVRVMQE